MWARWLCTIIGWASFKWAGLYTYVFPHSVILKSCTLSVCPLINQASIFRWKEMSRATFPRRYCLVSIFTDIIMLLSHIPSLHSDANYNSVCIDGCPGKWVMHTVHYSVSVYCGISSLSEFSNTYFPVNSRSPVLIPLSHPTTVVSCQAVIWYIRIDLRPPFSHLKTVCMTYKMPGLWSNCIPLSHFTTVHYFTIGFNIKSSFIGAPLSFLIAGLSRIWYDRHVCSI